MKRPLTLVAFLYVAGILLATIPVPLRLLFTIAFFTFALATVWTRARLILLGILVILAGWINLAHREAVLSPHDVRSLGGIDPSLVTLRGKLCETPQHRVHKMDGIDVWNSMVKIELQEIRFNKGNWQPAFGIVMANSKQMLPDTIFADQIIEVTGVLKPTEGPVAEGLFDYRAYLKQLGIYYQLQTDSVRDWQVLSSPSGRPWADRFTSWGKQALAQGQPEDEPLRLQWALTLGWKPAMTEEISEPFIQAATYHIFAVDGLRIAIISGIFFVLLRVLGVPRAICGLLVIPALWFYAAMTGYPASAIRAIIMVMVVYGGWFLKRPTNLINSLFVAAIIILVWEPQQLFQAGFQLSFFVVLCIILILPPFHKLTQQLLKTDPLLPEQLHSNWQKWWRKPAHYVLDLFFTSIAAWLGSIPLTSYYFHIITPGSGPANVPAVFLCGLVLIANLSSLLLAGWFPWAAELFNHAGWLMMKIIQVTSQWFAGLPGCFYYVPTPTVLTICIQYALLLAVLTGWVFGQKYRRWRLAGVTALILLWCAQWSWQKADARLTILPLGGGHAVYAHRDGKDWLINVGKEFSTEATLKPFLQAQGVNRLDNLILTHGEIDYSGGAELISSLFPPRQVYTSQIKFRSPDYIKFQKTLESTPGLKKPVACDDMIGPWKVLYPSEKAQFAKAQDNVMVLRGDFGALRVLLLSDLGWLGQNALLQRTNDLHADIVVTGIPVEGEPLNDALLDLIQPKVVVIADTDNPITKKAGSKLQERLSKRSIPILYTRHTDAITLTVRGNKWNLAGMDGTRILSNHTSP